jgi:hypothetical protein
MQELWKHDPECRVSPQDQAQKLLLDPRFHSQPNAHMLIAFICESFSQVATTIAIRRDVLEFLMRCHLWMLKSRLAQFTELERCTLALLQGKEEGRVGGTCKMIRLNRTNHHKKSTSHLPP